MHRLLAACIGLGSLFAATAAYADGSGCIAHRPRYVENVLEIEYTSGCSGHDEPELVPISDHSGSAKELTWTFILPKGGSFSVSATGPTFWFGGPVTDPNSFGGQAFVELQFYPDGIVTNCTPGGGFVLKHMPDAYSVCSPVWKVTQQGTKAKFHETAAFNAMLTDSNNPKNPLVMYAGDKVTVHWYTTQAQDGWHVTVTDVTTGGTGTIILNSPQDGPLMPVFDTQVLGNSLVWGLVYDAPASFVWEIGHTSPFTNPASAYCNPGDVGCYSYDAPAWAGTTPIQILDVTFGDGSGPQHWAVVSDFGGKAEINQHCSTYGGPYCIYPWFTLGTGGFHYGVDYPDNANDFNKADQFTQTTDCPGKTYCATVIQ
jgi:hypothetical protein